MRPTNSSTSQTNIKSITFKGFVINHFTFKNYSFIGEENNKWLRKLQIGKEKK